MEKNIDDKSALRELKKPELQAETGNKKIS